MAVPESDERRKSYRPTELDISEFDVRLEAYRHAIVNTTISSAAAAAIPAARITVPSLQRRPLTLHHLPATSVDTVQPTSAMSHTPPPKPSPNHRFDTAHPLKVTTLRPTTWYALESFLEFLIAAYCLWAAFYLVYISVCCAVWVVRKAKDCMNPWRVVRRRKQRERGEEDGSGYGGDGRGESACARWWQRMRGRNKRVCVRGGMRDDEEMVVGRSDEVNMVYDYDGKTRVRRRTV